MTTYSKGPAIDGVFFEEGGKGSPTAQLSAPVVAQYDAVKPVTLIDGTTIDVDASKGGEFRVTLAGNRTLANPTNLIDGQILTFRIKQDATGSRTITWGNKYRFGTTVAQPTLTTTAGKSDYLTFRYNKIEDKLDCTEAVLGY